MSNDFQEQPTLKGSYQTKEIAIADWECTILIFSADYAIAQRATPPEYRLGWLRRSIAFQKVLISSGKFSRGYDYAVGDSNNHSLGFLFLRLDLHS